MYLTYLYVTPTRTTVGKLVGASKWASYQYFDRKLFVYGARSTTNLVEVNIIKETGSTTDTYIYDNGGGKTFTLLTSCPSNWMVIHLSTVNLDPVDRGLWYEAWWCVCWRGCSVDGSFTLVVRCRRTLRCRKPKVGLPQGVGVLEFRNQS